MRQCLCFPTYGPQSGAHRESSIVTAHFPLVRLSFNLPNALRRRLSFWHPCAITFTIALFDIVPSLRTSSAHTVGIARRHFGSTSRSRRRGEHVPRTAVFVLLPRRPIDFFHAVRRPLFSAPSDVFSLVESL